MKLCLFDRIIVTDLITTKWELLWQTYKIYLGLENACRLVTIYTRNTDKSLSKFLAILKPQFKRINSALSWSGNVLELQANGFFFSTRAAVSRFLPMHTQAPYLVIDATLLSSSATFRVIMQSWITIVFIPQWMQGWGRVLTITLQASSKCLTLLISTSIRLC